jgi:aspartate kinase
VPTARLLPSVSPSEAAELTFYGSEVIHPFTMEQVIKARIPIRIKNVLKPRGQGTVILPDAESLADPIRPKLFRGRSSSSVNSLYQPKRPTAVTIKHSIVVINIHSNRRTRAHGFLANIFSILDKHHLSVDLISSSEVHVSMALHSEYSMLSGSSNDSAELKIQDLRLHGAVEDLAKLGNVDIVSDMAIVSLVGKQLKNMYVFCSFKLSTVFLAQILFEFLFLAHMLTFVVQDRHLGQILQRPRREFHQHRNDLTRHVCPLPFCLFEAGVVMHRYWADAVHRCE